MVQEKKERLEDKMAATMEVNATVFTCKQVGTIVCLLDHT
jgi:hypothetical protein